MNIIDSFVLDDTNMYSITKKEYKEIEHMVEYVASFARIIHQKVYIIDLIRRRFLYVSDSLPYLCEENAEEIKEMGYKFYLKYVPEEELQMLLEIHDKALAFFNQIPEEERQDYVMSYDFHLAYGYHKELIHHKLTPFRLASDGRVWLVLCSISLSARKEAGHVTMRRKGSRIYYELMMGSDRWVEKEEVELTAEEKKVLLLSARGFNMLEIATKICRSVDSVKSYKRRLFERAGVASVTEALAFVLNYGLL